MIFTFQHLTCSFRCCVCAAIPAGTPTNHTHRHSKTISTGSQGIGGTHTLSMDQSHPVSRMRPVLYIYGSDEPTVTPLTHYKTPHQVSWFTRTVAIITSVIYDGCSVYFVFVLVRIYLCSSHLSPPMHGNWHISPVFSTTMLYLSQDTRKSNEDLQSALSHIHLQVRFLDVPLYRSPRTWVRVWHYAAYASERRGRRPVWTPQQHIIITHPKGKSRAQTHR